MEEPAAAREVRGRYEVPPAVRLVVSDEEVLAFLPPYEVPARAVAGRFEDLPPAGVAGRSLLRRLDSPEGPVLARECRKGGLLRRLRGRRFVGRWRPLEELVLLRRLRAVGVPVVEAVGAVVLRSRAGWRGFLLSREVESSIDLARWSHDPASREEDRAEVLRSAGRTVRLLHDAGVAHGDLHPKNLLLAPDGNLLVLDLDRARPAEGRLADEDRFENLVRLGRAVEKHRLKGLRFTARDALRFLQGYAGTAAAARPWYERISARLARGLWWRRIWWRLLGEARPWTGGAPQGAR